MSSTVLMKWLWPTMIFPSVGMSRRMAWRSMGPLSHRCAGGDGGRFGLWFHDPIKLDRVCHALEQSGRSAGLGSFCNFHWRGKWRRYLADLEGDQGAECVGGLQGFQFFEAAV